jgi:hypothetical protein
LVVAEKINRNASGRRTDKQIKHFMHPIPKNYIQQKRKQLTFSKAHAPAARLFRLNPLI